MVATRADGDRPKPLRIVFSMRNLWYIRIFESVIRELAARGHSVHIAAGGGLGRERAREWNEAAEALVAELPNVTLGWVPLAVHDDWVDLRIGVHLGLDYLRFLGPMYAGTPSLVKRARERAPEFVVRASERPGMSSAPGRRLLAAALRAVERAIPVNVDLERYIRDERPDVILITPLLTLGSDQQDVPRIARAMGVPSVLCVGSWDHLSSKALIRDAPDRVLVWNETQRREAVELHGLSPDAVTVTGAQCFDQWFDRKPTLDRDSFCRKVGVDPSKPFIAYVCSALFAGSPSEAEWVMQWVAAVRASSNPTLANASIVIRQHPKRGMEWEHIDLTTATDTVLWPPVASAPFQDSTKSDYFDTLYHSAAVVGLNTSALIEGGIVGRAVHTVLLPEFQDNQEGTLHFHYLLDQGLLVSARSLREHVEQLARSVEVHRPDEQRNADFLRTFVRPRGLDVSATTVVRDTIEAVAAEGARRRGDPWWTSIVRSLVAPLAPRLQGTLAEQVNRERRRRAKAQARDAVVQARVSARQARIAEKTRLRDARMAEKARLREQRRESKQRQRAAKQVERQRSLAER